MTPVNFLLFAMPRSATHFTALFSEKYFASRSLDHYVQFRTFRNFVSPSQQLEYLDARRRYDVSLYRITCQEETENLEKNYGLERFLSESTTIILKPRADIVDLLLARLIPYYHWTRSQFDGLPVKENYYSFYKRNQTWSPYFPEDIQALKEYYLENKLPFDEVILNDILEIVFDFFKWYGHHRRMIKSRFDYVEFNTDDLLIEPNAAGEILCGAGFPLLEYFNRKLNGNVAKIKLLNMKQQSREEKLKCFERPQEVLGLIDKKISAWGAPTLNGLLYV